MLKKKKKTIIFISVLLEDCIISKCIGRLKNSKSKKRLGESLLSQEGLPRMWGTFLPG